jgi:hypothetical protein
MPAHGRQGLQRRQRVRPMSVILVGVAVLGVSLAFQPPAGGQNAPAQPVPVQPVNAKPGPLDAPLAMLREGQRTFATVKDYTFTLQSRENIRGVLQAEDNVMICKMRTQPFSVYMRWLAPRADAGQEVCFVAGRNNNMMRVHSKKLGKGALLGFHSLDTNDPRVREHSRHSILEAGLGTLIDHTIKHWEYENSLGKTQVKTAEYTCNNRRCLRVETTRPERIKGFYSYRSVLYIDVETKLPIRTESYDWPRQGGPADGELLELFSYIDLRLNVGLPDATFNK